uniref:TLC domain containing 3B n=1 Tax=Salarias fasciatus TaxID=181472 RepID=A0A672HLF7_SALFA
ITPLSGMESVPTHQTRFSTRTCPRRTSGRPAEPSVLLQEHLHWLTDAYIFFATPYFAYDVYAMYLCHHHRLRVKGHEEAEEATLAAVAGFLRRESLMVLHHVFLVAFCFPASVFWRQGKGDYFQALLFLAELSTPSVSLGKVLIQVNRPHTLLHRANGLVLLLTFFCCRVLLFPYLYYAVLAAPWQCNLGAGLLWPLQLYWFSLICRRALGQFSRRPPGNATAGRHGSPLGNTNTANQSDGHRG